MPGLFHELRNALEAREPTEKCLAVTAIAAREWESRDFADRKEAVAAIGWRYDLRNVFDLARYLIPVRLVPNRWRSGALHFGSREPTEVMCSSLIARLFQAVRFPILPSVHYPDAPPRRAPGRALVRRVLGEPSDEYTGLFRMRHPRLVTPRDFDLSPYFDILKFNQLADGDFDYRRMRWDEERDSAPRERPRRAATDG